jgi:hypothetical protein
VFNSRANPVNCLTVAIGSAVDNLTPSGIVKTLGFHSEPRLKYPFGSVVTYKALSLT